jgi:hypothetical protein
MLMKPNYTKAKSPNDSLVDESFAYYATRKVAITFGFETKRVIMEFIGFCH